MRILTVCIGNICRSPLAERLLRLRLADLSSNDKTTVESAGVGAVVGHPIDNLALAQLERLGGSGSGFMARQITTAIVAEADLVLTATLGVRARVLREDPRALKRTFTLGEFAAICDRLGATSIDTAGQLVAVAGANRPTDVGDLDLRDPIGLGPAEHRAVADLIDGYVNTITTRLRPLLTR